MMRKGNDKGIFLVVSFALAILVGFMLLNMAGIRTVGLCTEEDQHTCCPSIHDRCEKNDDGVLICDIYACNSDACKASCQKTGDMCRLVGTEGTQSCVSRECDEHYRTCFINECESQAFRYNPEIDQTSWRTVYVDEENVPHCCNVVRINERVTKSC